MSQATESDNERPCLHCLIGDLIDEFFEEFGTLAGEPATVDSGELMSALAKTFAELTYDLETDQRQRILEDFMGEVSKFESEFREAQSSKTPASDARH